MGHYTGKTCRLIFMLVLTPLFFLSEIVAGFMSNSIALVSDSLITLSNVLSLCVGLMVACVSRRAGCDHSTYGLARVKVVGIFLEGLCFCVTVASVVLLIEPKSIRKPLLVMVIGALGLAVNAVGLFIFQDYKLCSLNNCAASSTGNKNIGISREAGASTLSLIILLTFLNLDGLVLSW